MKEEWQLQIAKQAKEKQQREESIEVIVNYYAKELAAYHTYKSKVDPTYRAEDCGYDALLQLPINHPLKHHMEIAGYGNLLCKNPYDKSSEPVLVSSHQMYLAVRKILTERHDTMPLVYTCVRWASILFAVLIALAVAFKCQ